MLKIISQHEVLTSLTSPVRRVLSNNHIATLPESSKFSEAEIFEFHGMGPGSIPKLWAALKTAGSAFRK